MSTLGVTLAGDGIDIGVHAPDADAIAVCLFDAAEREVRRIRLGQRIGPVWHEHIPGVTAGMRYGLRAYGPWDPANGHRFNPSKLLVDPWATRLDRPFRLDPKLFDVDAPKPDDTAALMPKAIIEAAAEPGQRLPDFDWDRQVIYELHVRGFTMTHPDIPPAIRGTFAGLGHPAAIAHLRRLGVTTVELMPCAAWADERHLPPLGLSDYWGYNPMAFMAPDPRLAPGGWADVRAAVDALHAAGIAVILDVVLNHTAESDELGPTLSLRGLDNGGYYRLADDRSRYVNDAGCGNVLAMDHPIALRLGMDALRAWAVRGGLDGFRLDLAVTLARGPAGFDAHGAFLAAAEQDPVLSGLVMIAEPWDIGPGGYRLGEFPAAWGEWNDRFRDTARRFWRGDGGMLGDFTTRFAGSTDVFRGRTVSRSINYITAHDGFTLADLVSYAGKHNAANGEQNRDGSDDNKSWNNGTEGATQDPSIRAARAADVRALLATLLLSRGTPMLCMGDEAGRTQNGNNNAYAQDNEGAWMDWAAADDGLIDYAAGLIALRRELGPLFTGSPLQGRPIGDDAVSDVTWLRPDAAPMGGGDWGTAGTLIADLAAGLVRAVLVFHPGIAPFEITLPHALPGQGWQRAPDPVGGLTIAPRSVTVFRQTEDSGAHRQAGVSDAEVDRLAEGAGIAPIWWDVEGGYHQVSQATKRTLLAAMRLPAATQGELTDSLSRLRQDHDRPIPLVALGRPGEPITLRLGRLTPRWITMVRQDGQAERYDAGGGDVVLPPQPLGRHGLLDEDRPDSAGLLIVAPVGCYLPPDLAAGNHRFGLAAHLYSLRSAGDQGIGDFTTLSRFAATAAANGASMVGLNPLHALFPHDRSRASPYHPSDRRFLDPMYIDVSGFPGGGGAEPVPGAVDYETMWAHKRAVLLAAFEATTQAGVSADLQRFATFQAIAEARRSSDWSRWPADLRHPTGAGVAAFAAAHADEVAFHAWMQTLAEAQFAAAAASPLKLGFYRDLAVGAAPDGAEAWSAQDLLMQGVSVGAPPDPFSANGQVWCLPPPDPIAMRRDGYANFRELVASNMRHAGALRIDHVMALRRLFVVPDGASAADGAYVAYPMPHLIAQIALESHRARCLVVGEDLGTVPEGMPQALAEANILSYSVLWFERQDGRIRPPALWRRLAAACVSTHDLPTLAGWWDAADVAEKRILGLLDDVQAEQLTASRQEEKAELVALLESENLLDEDVGPGDTLPLAVAAAVHAFVSATPALLALLQADDLAGERVAVNLPGTDKERPNWRRRLDIDVEQLCETPLARAILAALHARAA